MIIKVKEFCNNYTSIDLNGQLQLFKGKIYEYAMDDGQMRTTKEILVPNPWRTKANGKIIRHMPITLYSDDTSGNVSKRWNKHLSFYFTLSGLPPGISNQEFNCHFLATSNRAGVFELSEPVVDELK
jgi:hypothetical protein